MKLLCPALVLATAALPGPAVADSAVSLPRAAYVRDASGELRALDGVAGTFVAGERIAQTVRAFAAWGERAVAATGSRIVLVGGGKLPEPIPAFEGRALLGLDERGEPAVAVYPGESAVLLRAGGWRPLRIRLPEGRILAAAATARGAVLVLAVAREDGLWIVHRLARSGATLREQWVAPEATAACLAPNGRIVFAAAGQLVVREESGLRRAAPVSGQVEALEPAGRGWIQIHRKGAAGLIARIDGDRVQVFRIPEGRR